MADLAELTRQLAYLKAGGGQKSLGQQIAEAVGGLGTTLGQVGGTFQDIRNKQLENELLKKKLAEGQSLRLYLEGLPGAKQAALSQMPEIQKTAGITPSPETAGLYGGGIGKEGVITSPVSASDRAGGTAMAQRLGLPTEGLDILTAKEGKDIFLKSIESQKTQDRTPYKSRDISITPEMQRLSGGLLKAGETRKGFEIDEVFKQNREQMKNMQRFEMKRFEAELRDKARKGALPPASVLKDISDIQKSIDALNTIEELARNAMSQGLLPIGRLQGYFTEAKQFTGQLSPEESEMRARILLQNAETLRNLGGTALTKTEKETFEQSFPLLTISPTEFFGRLNVVRENLYNKQDAIEDTSARFGRPIAPSDTSSRAKKTTQQKNITDMSNEELLKALGE